MCAVLTPGCVRPGRWNLIKAFYDISHRGWKRSDFTAILTGGAEHAVLHLLYARFWHKVLFDLGVVTSAEPFQRLVSQGMILGEVGPHFPSPTP